jgi:oligopeptide transport system permease protein
MFPLHGLPARLGLVVLVLMAAACLGSLPWTLGAVDEGGASVPRYNAGDPSRARIPPALVPGRDADDPAYLLGTDLLGRSVLVRALTGGGISLGIGMAAALVAVTIGTLYGAVAGYVGGVADAVMMRVVDVLYGLPYILLVVLLAVASDAMVDEYITRSKARSSWLTEQVAALTESPVGGLVEAEAWLRARPGEADRLREEALAAVPPRRVSPGVRSALDVATLLVAIGGVSWLTLARVIRGQVLSLKNQPFVEAARAAGAGPRRVFLRHLLPNLVGPIVVYVTLTVPQAILQESFLSFLGIGVKPPLPSWGNLAAEGLSEVNPYKSNWWLLAVPSVLLGVTLLALNFVGEGLREALDPKRAGRRGAG